MTTQSPGAVFYRGDSRRMTEVADGSIDLVVTSPPYWQIKDYGAAGQIGAGESLHAYLRSLAMVWEECLRALAPGGRLCVNIGDQFARASLYGRYSVVPLHAEVTCQACALGFDFLGSIIWQKKTTMNTSGGAVVMGSFPYPPNGIVELDYEYIHIFRTPGKSRKATAEIRAASVLTTAEWKSFFSGHWNIAGARKREHEAPFPEEIPRRLIRMFSFVGGTVLDPFMGSGTTARAALALGRSAIGYEINPRTVREAARSIGTERVDVRTAPRRPPVPCPEKALPRIADMMPKKQAPEKGRPHSAGAAVPVLHRVVRVHSDCTLEIETGERVGFLGLRLKSPAKVRAYLEQRILRRQVFLRDAVPGSEGLVEARVVLKNRISVNGHLLKTGLAVEKSARS